MNSIKEGWTAGLEPKYEDAGQALARVLVVDDLELFRTFVSSILKQQPGYEIVGEAADGLEAVQKAREYQPDLVVLDLNLPELNGIEVAQRIRLCSPHSRILLLTANKDSELALCAFDAGVLGYVLKIDAVRDLPVAAKEVLSGRRFVSRRLGDQA